MKKYILFCFLAVGLGFGLGGWLATSRAISIFDSGEACKDYQIELQRDGNYGVYDGGRLVGITNNGEGIEILINEDEE